MLPLITKRKELAVKIIRGFAGKGEQCQQIERYYREV